MMRHAQSEERLTSVRDHDRPITEAGRLCAQEVRRTLPARQHAHAVTALEAGVQPCASLHAHAHAVASHVALTGGNRSGTAHRADL
jgi:hypothetical protein